MNKYYINAIINEENDGGKKARTDINKILQKHGYKEIFIPYITKTKHIFKLIRGIFNTILLFIIPHNSILVYQVPHSRFIVFDKIILKVQALRNIYLVVIIHDIESLRKIYIRNSKQSIWEQKIYEKCDVLICHNEIMKKYLVSRGIKAKKIMPINIFDYIVQNNFETNYLGNKNIVSIAGNLTYIRNAYIYKLSELNTNNIEFKLYGFGIDFSLFNKDIKYYGSFSPSEIVSKLTDGWGLVWEGQSLNECSGVTGEYTHYINQHKVSLYLVSGLPIIIWTNAGLADFVKDNGLGICISSLNEMEQAINAVSSAQYAQIKKNVEQIAYQLRNGHYTSNVIKKAEYYIHEN